MARVHDGEWKHTADEDSEDLLERPTGLSGARRHYSIPVDKSELVIAIGEAQGLLEGAEIGTEIGKYPEAAYGTFSDAIDAAQAVADDDNATQQEVDAAVDALLAAMIAFEEAEIKE